jgi:hypothetical protein
MKETKPVAGARDRMRPMKQVYVGFLLLVLLAGCSQRAGRVTAPDPVIAEFEKLIQAYGELRGRLDGGAVRLVETAQPEEIITAEKVLGAKIQTARSAARRGDIFTARIERQFRALLSPQLKGVRGGNTRGIIMDENPGSFPFKVNDFYPKEEPLGTVPPNVLAALPPLPEGLEYRFINKHLILRDSRANLIVDFIPNAIS